MYNSLTFKDKVPYELRPFNYCRLLNDSVRAASITRETNSGGNPNEHYTIPAIYLIPEEINFKKIEFKYCLKCIPYLRRWKRWLPYTENKYVKKTYCTESYNNKYTSKLNLMTDEEIETIKKEYVFYLSELINELHFLQTTTAIFSVYHVKKAEYIIQEQYKTKNKLKNLLGNENYEKLMTKKEMIKYLKN